MAPNQSDAIPGPSHVDPQMEHKEQKNDYKWEIIWPNVLLFIYMHVSFVYGFYLYLFEVKFVTFLWTTTVGVLSALGITAGAHRLWSHRSYKATWQLRLLLTFFQTMAVQTPVYNWARDHRVHHKFTETDADPHNAKRGIFYSHIGWLLVRKHPDLIRKCKTVDFSDLHNDRIVMFQKKWYIPLSITFALIMPSVVPWYFWNETFHNSWYVAVMFRFVLALNFTFLINSAAHHTGFGKRAYDKNINPNDSIQVAIATLGEGSHNFHHTFPWDYRSAELAVTSRNLTTGFINLFARIGWAYDLKYASVDTVRKRAMRTGDGTYEKSEGFVRGFQVKDGLDSYGEKTVWGWGDTDLPVEDQKAAVIEARQL